MTHCLTPRRPTERPEVGRLILVAERVAADYDRVGPARNETRDVVEHDRLAEDDTAQDVADCAVGRAPHLLQTEFLDPCLVGRDGRAFDADAIFLHRLGRLYAAAVLGLVALLTAKAEIEEVVVDIGLDLPLPAPLPDVTGPLVSLHFDARSLNFFFCTIIFYF